MESGDGFAEVEDFGGRSVQMINEPNGAVIDPLDEKADGPARRGFPVGPRRRALPGGRAEWAPTGECRSAEVPR